MQATTWHKSPSSESLAALVKAGRVVLRLPEDRALLASHGIIDLDPLLRQGFLERMDVRGLFRIRQVPRRVRSDQLAVASALVSHNSYYISWWTALSHHRLTEQLPRTIWVATTVYRPTTSVQGTVFRFVRLADRKFFGFQPLAVPGGHVLMASKSKAVIDSLERPEYAGGLGEVGKAIASPRVTVPSLIQAARRQEVQATTQRLGWFIENIRKEDASPLLALCDRDRRTIPIDRRGGHWWAVDTRWNVGVNFDAASLDAQLQT